MSYNIWAKSTTLNDYATDEVISMLQKTIRRSMVEEACQCAYELYTSGPLFLEKLWRRLLVISVEDVGFGNLEAAQQIYVLNQMRKEFPFDDGDQAMFFIHAIRILCASTKDRSSDYLKNIIVKEAAMGKKFQIMDVALDKHTVRGMAMGRDSKHFFEVGAVVTPQLEVDNDYRERYGKILATYSKDKDTDKAFKFSSYQY